MTPRHTKILLGLPHGNRLGGVATWCMNVANELTSLGNDVGILVHDGIRTSQYRCPERVKMHNLKGRPSDWAFRHDIAEVRRYLKQEIPLVFFPNGGHCGYAAAAQLKRNHTGLRVVATAHSDEDPIYETLEYYAPIIDSFIGVSYIIANKIRDFLPKEREADVTSLPCGVPIRPGSPRNHGGIIKLLYAGRVVETQKRVSRLAELADELDRLEIPYEFHVAGDGCARESLGNILRGRALFHGAIEPDEVRVLMEECHILVQFSDFEGTSVTMLEGMAAGMVPVMSAVTGIDAVIDHEINGYLHPIGDVGLAAAQCALLHQDRMMLDRIGQAARDKVAQHFSIQANASVIAALCNNLQSQPSAYRVLPGRAFPLKIESRIFLAKAKGKIQSEMRKIGVLNR
jgi:glycosyltransferase involved in cell wall biosynthesis